MSSVTTYFLKVGHQTTVFLYSISIFYPFLTFLIAISKPNLFLAFIFFIFICVLLIVRAFISILSPFIIFIVSIFRLFFFLKVLIFIFLVSTFQPYLFGPFLTTEFFKFGRVFFSFFHL